MSFDNLDDLIGVLREATPNEAAITHAQAGLMEALGDNAEAGTPEPASPTRPSWAVPAAAGLLAVLVGIGVQTSPPIATPADAPGTSTGAASDHHARHRVGAHERPTGGHTPRADRQEGTPPALVPPGETLSGGRATRSERGRPAREAPRRDVVRRAPVRAPGNTRPHGSRRPQPDRSAAATRPRSPRTLRATARPALPLPPPAASRTGAGAVLDVARREMGERNWAAAAARLQAVRDGRTDATPVEAQEAELRIARCLLELGLVHAALEALAQIAEFGPAHAFFEDALPALGRLAGRVPEPARLIEAVGRYDDGVLLRVRDERPALAYLGGRARFASGDLDAALTLLARVPDTHPFGLEARLVESITHVRQRHAVPAERSLQRLITAVDDGRAQHTDPTRMRHLAYLDLGRLRYSRAMAHPLEAAAERELDRALDAWRHVPLEAPLGEIAFFEETWALFGLGHPERALGHVHTLRSPMLARQSSLEALAIRAIIQLEHCQWTATQAAVDEARAAIAPRRVALRSMRERVTSPERAYQLLLDVRGRRVALPAAARRRVTAAFDDPAVGRQVLTVQAIAAEQTRLGRAPLAQLEPGLRTAVAGVLREARRAAVHRVGRRATRDLDGMLARLDGLESRLDTIEIEMTTAQREELTRPNRRPMGPAEGGPIWAIQGGARWPWDGEWWTDELPHFRQEITSRCGR